MAAFQDVAAEILGLLNRDDCTGQLISYFIANGMRRIQRVLRIPSMERHRLITTQFPTTYVAVPQDFITMIDIHANSGVGLPLITLERKAFRQISAVPEVVDPRYYARLSNNFQIRGAVPAGGLVEMIYYGAFTPLFAPTDTNELTLEAPDLLTYAALGYAADHFQHPSKQLWEATYQSLLGDVMGLSAEIDNTGGPAVIQPFAGGWGSDADCGYPGPWSNYG